MAPIDNSEQPSHTVPLAADALGWEVLARYFAGRMTDADEASFLNWLGTGAQQVARQREVDMLRTIWEHSTEAPVASPADVSDVDGVWAAMIGRMDATDAEVRPVRRDVSAVSARSARTMRTYESGHRWVRGWRAAAAAAILAAVLKRGAANGRAPRTSAVTWRRHVRVSLIGMAAIGLLAVGLPRWYQTESAKTATASVVGPWRELATRRGQRAALTLHDGTRVVVGPESRVRYPATFGDGPREITLEGAARFVVTHDARHPFLVRTATSITEDLGTDFAVRAYRADSMVDVVVAAGKVALRTVRQPDGAGIALEPGDGARMNDRGLVRVRRGVNVATQLAWSEGRLVFVDTPLRQALLEIGRWHDVDVRVADPALGDRLLNGTFRDEPIAHILDIIGATLGLRVERVGSVFVLSSPARSR